MNSIRLDRSGSGPMNIRILGASSYESGSHKCVSFLIDDVIAVDAGALASILPDLKKLKAILLTHQHYDHVKDIPFLAISLFSQGRSINVYCTSSVRDSIIAHVLNGAVYPRFHELPVQRPTISFTTIEPYSSQNIEGYDVLAVPVNHPGDTVGFQVRNSRSQSVFYTADTGPGLSRCWAHISPQLIISETTMPNSSEEFALRTGHLTPNCLCQELVKFREMKGYLPPVVVTHTDPFSKEKIRREIAEIARTPGMKIDVAYEGMRVAVGQENRKLTVNPRYQNQSVAVD
jgi:ribonuclease BN (tRNA processing enzyme)